MQGYAIDEVREAREFEHERMRRIGHRGRDRLDERSTHSCASTRARVRVLRAIYRPPRAVARTLRTASPCRGGGGEDRVGVAAMMTNTDGRRGRSTRVRDSIGFVRWLMAFMVIFSHAGPLAGFYGGEGPRNAVER